VARFVNLLAESRESPRKADIAAIVHGPATNILLGNATYHAKTGAGNPNLALIRRLRESGVESHVLGQALAERGFDPEAVASQIQVELTALITLVTYQLWGFALIPE